MWIKKSELELEDNSRNNDNSEKLSKTIKIGIWSFIVIFLGKILFSITIGIRITGHSAGPRELVKINEIPEYFHYYLISAIIWTIGLMVAYYFKSSFVKGKGTTLMCDKCFHTKNYDKEFNCQCGGHYYPISSFKWIEPKENLKYPDMGWLEKFKVEKNEG